MARPVVSLDATPVLSTLSIAHARWEVFQGQTVALGLEVRTSGLFSPRVLLDATEPPTLTLWDPTGALVVDDDAMTRLTRGRYGYAHATLATDPLGVWTARYTAGVGAGLARLDQVGAFLLLRGTFAVLTVFAIKDQDERVWYWWIDAAGQARSTPDLPPPGSRMPEVLNLDQIPSWITVPLAPDETRVIYPLVTGDFMPDFVPPPLGFGWEGSPVFTAQNGHLYTLGVDLLTQLLVVPYEPL